MFERWRKNRFKSGESKVIDSPKVTPVTSSESSERTRSASAILAELTSIQRDPVKTAIVGFGSGSVYYPLESGNVIPVDVVRIMNPFDTFANWKERGFSDEDLKSGLVQIKVGWPIDAEYGYKYLSGNATITNGTTEELWMSGTGTVLRHVETPDGGQWKLDQNPPVSGYTDAVQRIQRLSHIPHEIREQFGSYENFVRAYLQENGEADVTDTKIAIGFLQNGVDYFASNDSVLPWRLFQVMGTNPLKRFVDALGMTSEELDTKVDSTNYRLRTSVDGNAHGVTPAILPHSPRASGM